VGNDEKLAVLEIAENLLGWKKRTDDFHSVCIDSDKVDEMAARLRDIANGAVYGEIERAQKAELKAIQQYNELIDSSLQDFKQLREIIQAVALDRLDAIIEQYEA